MTDQLENKLALTLFSDGGGDRNHRFERVQVGLLHLAVMFNLEKTFAVKTAAGGSCWNMVERCTSALDVALFTCALNRVETGKFVMLFQFITAN